jgi:hypothetical protein
MFELPEMKTRLDLLPQFKDVDAEDVNIEHFNPASFVDENDRPRKITQFTKVIFVENMKSKDAPPVKYEVKPAGQKNRKI